MKKYIFFLFSVLLISYACKKKQAISIVKPTPVNVSNEELKFQESYKVFLEDTINKIVTIDDTAFIDYNALIKDFYEKNGFLPVWIGSKGLNSKGLAMYSFIEKSPFYALNSDLYDFKQLQIIANQPVFTNNQPISEYNYYEASKLEFGLTKAFFNIALHLNKGIFVDTNTGINKNFIRTKSKYVNLLAKTYLSDSNSVSTNLLSVQPNNKEYNNLMKAIYAFVSKNNISKEKIKIRNSKLDSLGHINDVKTALVYHHYLNDSVKGIDSMYFKALKAFQKDNNVKPNGLVNIYTVKALEKDNYKRFQTLVVNADRWRKQPSQESNYYVTVNLPSFKLKIFRNDSLKLEKNVVIGKPSNKTPTLESTIHNIVLWPDWTVPQSIIKKEMKSFRGYNVIKTNYGIRVVQPPGLRNALGVVKIQFLNSYSVYIHDTPSKSFFGEDSRVYSHGCVRCEKPLEVASFLLQHDKYPALTLDSLTKLKNKKVATRNFKITNKVPIYFRYFTAEVLDNGLIMVYNDVYSKDKDAIDFIFNNKQAHKASAKEIKAIIDSLKNDTTTIIKDTTFFKDTLKNIQ